MADDNNNDQGLERANDEGQDKELKTGQPKQGDDKEGRDKANEELEKEV